MTDEGRYPETFLECLKLIKHLEEQNGQAYKQGYIDGQIQVYKDMRKSLEGKHELLKEEKAI